MLNVEKQKQICYPSFMDFSRPDNARLINKLKVLSFIRENKNVSRAELSRELLINKVSISEIVDSLIKEGLVKECGLLSLPSGRPSTLLDIDVKSGKVIALAIKEKGCLIALSDLKGKILRLERFAKGESEEETEKNLSDSLSRMLKGDGVRIYGAAIASNNDCRLDKVLNFPTIAIDNIEAQVIAEQKRCSSDLKDMLFIMASEHLSSYYNGIVSTDFAHIKVTDSPICFCQRSGCIDAVFSGDAFKRHYRANLSAKEILRREDESKIIFEALEPLSSAIAVSANSYGAKNAMLFGEYSDLKDEYYARLNNLTISKLPIYKDDFFVFKSVAGDNAIIEGTCLKALDRFFYKKELLEALKKIENY